MKSIKVIMFAVLLAFIAGTSIAGESLEQFDGIKGRSFHADFYDGKSCDSCHDSKKPLTFPADEACLNCHDIDDLVKATKRPEAEKWQNPHNNMHYGKATPCMECHGEHESRKPLCQGCHSFKYKNFQQ